MTRLRAMQVGAMAAGGTFRVTALVVWALTQGQGGADKAAPGDAAGGNCGGWRSGECESPRIAILGVAGAGGVAMGAGDLQALPMMCVYPDGEGCGGEYHGDADGADAGEYGESDF